MGCIKRGKYYYFRKRINGFDIRISLKTSIKYKAFFISYYIEMQYNSNKKRFLGLENSSLITSMLQKFYEEASKDDSDIAELRREAIAVDGYAGHSHYAIDKEINKILPLTQSNDKDAVANQANKILKRSNINDTHLELLNERERDFFNYGLLKKEILALEKDKEYTTKATLPNVDINKFNTSSTLLDYTNDIQKQNFLNQLVDEYGEEASKELLSQLKNASIEENKPNECTMLYSEVRDEYVKKKYNSNQQKKTVSSYVSGSNYLIKFLGNRPISKYTNDDLIEFRDMLLQCPSKYYKKDEFEGLSIKEVIKKNKELKEPYEVLSHGRIKTLLQNTKAVFRHAFTKKYIHHPIYDDIPLEDHSIKNDTELLEKQEDKAYNDEELNNIFNKMPEYHDKVKFIKLMNKNPERIYAVLISLFTGMRLKETCQLFLDNIKKEHGIYYFYIASFDKNVQTLKNMNAFRRVPIPKFLLEDMMFEKYLKLRLLDKDKKNRLLFKHLNGIKHITKPVAEQFWNKKSKKFIEKKHKTFHNLRATINTKLLRLSNVEKDMVFEILGHEKTNVVNSTHYFEDFELEAKKELLNRVIFDIDFRVLQNNLTYYYNLKR